MLLTISSLCLNNPLDCSIESRRLSISVLLFIKDSTLSSNPLILYLATAADPIIAATIAAIDMRLEVVSSISTPLLPVQLLTLRMDSLRRQRIYNRHH